MSWHQFHAATQRSHLQRFIPDASGTLAQVSSKPQTQPTRADHHRHTALCPGQVDMLLLRRAPLADINNRAMKELVEHMVPKLSPATIRDYTGIVRDVVASAINEDGEELFSRTWNEEFIDAPAIDKQRQPSATSEGITDIVKSAKGQYQMLYALLAGCGPMRAGEALGLEIDKHISKDFRTLHILQKAKRGKIQPFLKTKNGERDVDLCVPLAAMLRDFIGTRTHGLLFCTSTSGQLLQANTLQDSLHPILKKLHHEKGGFNIFRRFRITYLNNSDCPEKLQHFWSGHA